METRPTFDNTIPSGVLTLDYVNSYFKPLMNINISKIDDTFIPSTDLFEVLIFIDNQPSSVTESFRKRYKIPINIYNNILIVNKLDNVLGIRHL